MALAPEQYIPPAYTSKLAASVFRDLQDQVERSMAAAGEDYRNEELCAVRYKQVVIRLQKLVDAESGPWSGQETQNA